MNRPYGLPLKSGHDEISARDWQAMKSFVEGRSWRFPDPCCEEDFADPLLMNDVAYGAFPLGFDFHLTHAGPKLVEINTNAAGLATVMRLYGEDGEGRRLAEKFTQSVLKEYELAGRRGKPDLVAIVDDDAANQPLYPEMRRLAEVLRIAGIRSEVCSPEGLIFSDGVLKFDGARVDLVYNRLTDFRFVEPRHAALREAAVKESVVLTPHPAAYVRVADKRNLLRLKHPVNPEARRFSERSVEEWQADRKRWVFKPPQGAAAKGVYRGDKLTVTKLQTLAPDTLVQEMVTPPAAGDGSKYDIRVYTRDAEILAVVARHYGGQVMEMRSDLAGFRAVKILD